MLFEKVQIFLQNQNSKITITQHDTYDDLRTCNLTKLCHMWYLITCRLSLHNQNELKMPKIVFWVLFSLCIIIHHIILL